MGVFYTTTNDCYKTFITLLDEYFNRNSKVECEVWYIYLKHIRTLNYILHMHESVILQSTIFGFYPDGLAERYCDVFMYVLSTWVQLSVEGRT